MFLIGHPGTGKTRSIRAALNLIQEIPEPHIAPTSLTASALVDSLLENKRFIANLPDPPIEYNTMMIAADELGTFIHKYDDEMISVLTAFYDPTPYGHNRRGKEIKIKIKKPQLNILCGSTPSNLLRFMPEGAWDQGFTSRIIMVFSDERIVGDDFAATARELSKDLLHDLKAINAVVGEFGVTEDYRNLVNLWRQQGEAPAPNHPKLIHYNSRRRAHLYKLSMVAALDRGEVLLLTRDDFNRAMNWLVEAEAWMPEIFKAGAVGADSVAMEEAAHFILTAGPKGMIEQKVVNFLRERIPAHSVMRSLEIMERSGLVKALRLDTTTGQRVWAIPQDHPDCKGPLE